MRNKHKYTDARMYCPMCGDTFPYACCHDGPNEAHKKIETLQQQNKELIEALEFYANENNWSNVDSNEYTNAGSMIYFETDCKYDEYQGYIGGKLARATLVKIKGDL